MGGGRLTWRPPEPLPRSFFERPADVVAPELIGRVLWHETPEGVAALRIVETEAYGGESDPGSHGFRGMTERNRVMFGPPGHAYIYFTYGMHFCLNFVTEAEGVCSAVLIRAGEPVTGVELMSRRRQAGTRSQARLIVEQNIASGPAKLTQALGLGRAQNGLDLLHGPLGVGGPGGAVNPLVTGARVGIREGLDLMWRFAEAGNPHVSRPAPGTRLK